MGMFDMYCKCCGVGFSPFSNDKWYDKTAWLGKSVFVYKGVEIHFNRYNSYGSFGLDGPLDKRISNDKNLLSCMDQEYNMESRTYSKVLNVCELSNYDLHCVYHTSCYRKGLKGCTKAKALVVENKLQQQFFDEKKVMRKKSLHWLVLEPTDALSLIHI